MSAGVPIGCHLLAFWGPGGQTWGPGAFRTGFQVMYRLSLTIVTKELGDGA